ncbi:PfkB family carbohydrate kinase [Desulfogranum japonicum]|uniref:PfkB family carbohydrate kinase n=1 Tax=Desulfogranum japonicum TaxID=231447 RepID=UPI000403343F|nr:PfkB family carbohydrate kinase [Desulfogranum japonicum]
MAFKGIFFGLTTVDIINYVPRYPILNEKLKAERQLSLTGGPAANAAVAFAAFENECTLISGLGHHPLTALIKQDLNQYNISVIDWSDQPDRPPVLSSIIVDLTNGQRTIVYANSDHRRLKKETSYEPFLELADVLLVDGHYITEAVAIAKAAKLYGIPVVLDGGSWKNEEEQLLPYIDYAVCSEDFMPPDCQNATELIASLRQYGIKHIAVTRGERPTVAWDNGTLKEIPIMQVKAMDTLGAGDILHGAFCHYILEHDFFTSLARAAEVASLSCTALGTRSWIEQEKFA